ncbi:hypothetical protein P2H44_22955 [Albimonas sp. CAU 1670]|uniref:hypothetical protein n=1 Tax=Albimonas sp. CAU 1670 TaxID=3032599 RepID=UPI0023DCB2A3|nr:hypothetical protein [Albimonas sp. CAU 1670]MDF2235425.1 hypothetical protein [Albimonas sp. CAU 1670]
MPVIIDEVQVEAAAQMRGEGEGAPRASSAPAPRPLSRHALREMLRREDHRRARLEAD